MQELFSQLGIDWRLFLSQAANFLILLIVLRFFAYKPLLKLLKDRRQKIEDGLRKSDEADRRLGEVNQMAKDRLKDADREALGILRETEEKAKKLEAELLDKAKAKEEEAMRSTELIIKAKAEEAKRTMRSEAAALVNAAPVKAGERDQVKYPGLAYARALAEAAAGTLSPAEEKKIISNFLGLVRRKGDTHGLPQMLSAPGKLLREKDGRRKVV